VHVWNGEFSVLSGRSQEVQLLAFGVGGEVLASGSLDLTIRVSDLLIEP
jgi:hypothetical protein